MNHHVTLTPSQRAWHEKYKAVRYRLMGPEKRVNVIDQLRPTIAAKAIPENKSRPRPDADAHVKAYRIWQSCASRQVSMMEYAEQLCAELGTTLAEIRTPDRHRELVEKRDSVTFDLKRMYPNKSRRAIGRVTNKDQASVYHSLQREAERRGVKVEMIESVGGEYPSLEEDIKSGMMLRAMASKYGVGAATITRKMRSLGLYDMFKSRHKGLPQQLIDAIMQDTRDGMPITKISKKYQMSQNTIRKYRDQYQRVEAQARAE